MLRRENMKYTVGSLSLAIVNNQVLQIKEYVMRSCEQNVLSIFHGKKETYRRQGMSRMQNTAINERPSNCNKAVVIVACTQFTTSENINA